MKRRVETFNAIEGFHHYPDAPSFCSYLAARHRHIFEIRCSFDVNHNEREIEINETQKQIEAVLHIKFGTPCEFGSMSCESIAEYLIKSTGAASVQVLEDGYGGASLSEEY